MQASLPKARPPHVAIVSKNAETLDGLEAYLQSAGLATNATRQLDHAAQIDAATSALVLFPDDFDWAGVVSTLTEARRQNPVALLLLITDSPQRFETFPWPEAATAPVVLPKPAWGWTILDAIRAHRSEPSGSGSR